MKKKEENKQKNYRNLNENIEDLGSFIVNNAEKGVLMPVGFISKKTGISPNTLKKMAVIGSFFKALGIKFYPSTKGFLLQYNGGEEKKNEN